MSPPGREALAARILAWARHALADAPREDLHQLLLDVHRWQATHAPVVGALAGEVRHWTDIPAVPVSLFRQLRVGTVPEGAPSRVFRTSGTTTGRRGEHHLWSTELYDAVTTAWARHFLPEAPSRVVALLSDPAEAPDSSLSHMVATFPGWTDPPGRITWHLRGGRLVLPLEVEAPAFVATTAFALADWLDHDPDPLPAGSVLMITGGFKGRRTDHSPATLHAEAVARLRPSRIVHEYGMTELSSQLWGAPDSPYVAPPWLQVVPVDPATGRPTAPGEPGQLRFYDLLNLDSTVGVETLDQGFLDAEGHLVLLGRLPGAAARGCSLTVEEAWDHDR